MAPRSICQYKDIFTPWIHPQHQRLPGLAPIRVEDWLIQDDAYDAQMAYRDALIGSQSDKVHICRSEAMPAAKELLSLLTEELPRYAQGYQYAANQVTRADGTQIKTKQGPPLLICGQLAQEDFAILQKSGDQHIFTGGVICFPAHWSLAEKIDRTLHGLHEPVDTYDQRINDSMERIFNNLRPDAPLARANFLIYTDPDLYQPMSETLDIQRKPGAPRYVRAERQTLRRLPQTGAIIFSIHTYLYPASALTADAHAALAKLRPELIPH